MIRAFFGTASAAGLASMRNGVMIFIMPSTPSSPGKGTAITRILGPWPTWPRPCPTHTCTTAVTRSIAAARMAVRPAGLDGHCFLACMQNHDQVGNRARGERSSRLMNEGRLRIAAALVLTSPFIPLLFQGEEWGAATPFLYFTDHEDAAVAKAVREGRSREFAAFSWKPAEIPDPQARETFERSKLDWSELALPAHAGLLEWHRRLIELRRAEPSLTDGRMDRVQTSFDESERWLVMERGPILVVCNFGPGPQAIPLPAGKHQVLLASASAESLGNAAVRLPSDAVAIMSL